MSKKNEGELKNWRLDFEDILEPEPQARHWDVAWVDHLERFARICTSVRRAAAEATTHRHLRQLVRQRQGHTLLIQFGELHNGRGTRYIRPQHYFIGEPTPTPSR